MKTVDTVGTDMERLLLMLSKGIDTGELPIS